MRRIPAVIVTTYKYVLSDPGTQKKDLIHSLLHHPTLATLLRYPLKRKSPGSVSELRRSSLHAMHAPHDQCGKNIHIFSVCRPGHGYTVTDIPVKNQIN